MPSAQNFAAQRMNGEKPARKAHHKKIVVKAYFYYVQRLA